MSLKNLKKLLGDLKQKKDTRNKVIAIAVAGICIISLVGTLALHNKFNNETNDNKEVVTSTKKKEETKKTENKEEKKENKVVSEEEAKKQLEELKKADTSNLSNEEKKQTEEKIKSIETMIENKEYDKVAEEVQVAKEIVTPVKETPVVQEPAKVEEKKSEPVKVETPARVEEKKETTVQKHTHNWVDVTEDVVHAEEGHWEEVVVTPKQVKEVPVYEVKRVAICNGCGADITNNYAEHLETQMLSGNMNCSGYTVESREVQTGTKQEVTPAVTEKKWVVDKAASTETKVVGRKCSSCGTTE